MRLRDLREDRDLTQKQVADFLSIKQNTYSQYENGVRQLPIDLLIRLSRYYTVSTDYILERQTCLSRTHRKRKDSDFCITYALQTQFCMVYLFV